MGFQRELNIEISGGSTTKRHLLSHLVVRLNAYSLALTNCRYDILADSIIFDNVEKYKILSRVSFNKKNIVVNTGKELITFLRDGNTIVGPRQREIPVIKDSDKEVTLAGENKPSVDLNELSAEGLGGTEQVPMSEDNNKSLTTPNDSEQNLSNLSKYEIHTSLAHKTASPEVGFAGIEEGKKTSPGMLSREKSSRNIHSFDPYQKRYYHCSARWTISNTSSISPRREVAMDSATLKIIQPRYFSSKPISDLSFSSELISDLSFSSEVFDLGLFNNLKKTSLKKRAELNKLNPENFFNFFFLGLRPRLTHNLISKGFIKVMGDKACFASISLFFFNLSTLHLNNLKPENLSNKDLVKLNNLIGNRCRSSFNGGFLL